MFTGIIQAIGTISQIESKGGDVRITVRTGELDLCDVVVGDSIATNGVCLTVIELTAAGFQADISTETLALTTLHAVQPGSPVNLEKALTLNARLGGHLVSGHVDGIGRVIERREDARSVRLVIQAPTQLAKYIASKGSICVDGTSLTVNRIYGNLFDLNIVPHTLQKTIMVDYQPGREVNLEVDLIARYLERLMLDNKATDYTVTGITEDLLKQQGFIK